MTTFLIILIIFIAIIVIAGVSANKKRNEKCNELGITQNDLTQIGDYVSGHPNIDNSKNSVSYIISNNNIEFYDVQISLLAKTPLEQIKDVYIEDASTIEKRISAGRLLLVGVFALAWQKNKKNEMAFLILKLNDGRFDHECIFQFNGKDAISTANAKRNVLIRVLPK